MKEYSQEGIVDIREPVSEEPATNKVLVADNGKSELLSL